MIRLVNKVYMTKGLGCFPEELRLYPEAIWTVRWKRNEHLHVMKWLWLQSRRWIGGGKLEVHGVQVRDDGPALKKEQVDGEQGTL